MSMDAAAKAIGIGKTNLHRFETGQRAISTEDVAMITTAYRIPVKEREELMEFVRSGDSGGWWDRPLPGVPREMGVLASFEAEADTLADWSVMLVPGLLQTETYARAYMLADEIPSEEADLRWVARRRRQEVLGRVDYTAYIYEGALRIPFGGRSVHQQQVRHLLSAPDRGISVRLIREWQPAAVLSHSWLYMTFPNGVNPVVNVEVKGGGFYLQDDRAKPYTRKVEWLGETAVSVSETRVGLRSLLKEI